MTEDEENYISLLRYALEKSAPTHEKYFIGNQSDRHGNDDLLCLLRQDSGEWIIGYYERGRFELFGTFPDLRHAWKHFYWVVNTPALPSPYAFRKAWEQETGKTL